jgi:hypothetical protein
VREFFRTSAAQARISLDPDEIVTQPSFARKCDEKIGLTKSCARKSGAAQFGELSPNPIHPTLDIRPHIAGWVDKVLGAAFFQPKIIRAYLLDLIFKSATAPRAAMAFARCGFTAHNEEGHCAYGPFRTALIQGGKFPPVRRLDVLDKLIQPL